MPNGSFARWLDERTGLVSALARRLSRPIPGGPSFRHALHAATLALVALLFATGAALALFYAPTTTDAWASIGFLERAIPSGALLRAVHHHATSALVVVLLLELAAAVWSAAYRRPREVAWWLLLATVGLVLVLAMTGALLPWDQQGYWASRVEVSIIASAPLVGPLLLGLVQSGNDLGNLTLTRYYAAHALLLPALLVLVLAAYGRIVRKHGPAPSPDAPPITTRWWPAQAVRDLAVALVAIGVVFVVALASGAPLDAPADPASGFPARPAWYFRPLYVLRTWFEGPFEPIATMLVPGLAVLFVALLPFVDRSGSSRTRRLVLVGPVLAGFAFLPLATVWSLRADATDEAYLALRAKVDRVRDKAFTLAAAGVPAEGPLFMLRNTPEERGRRLFADKCIQCHAVSGEGGDEAPDLGGYLTHPWLVGVITQPDAPEYFGRTKVEGMESYAELGPEKLDLLARFVAELRTHPGVPADELPPHLQDGRALFEAEGCDSCHELDPGVPGAGPNLNGYGSDAWLDGLLKDAGHALYYGDMDDMPSYADLPDGQRRDLIAFLRLLEEEPVRFGRTDVTRASP